MVENTVEQNQHIPKSRNNSLLGTTIQIGLRVLSIAATLAAAMVMMTSKQSTAVFGIPVNARYTYSSAFKFFAYANLVACALCVLSLLILLTIFRRKDRCSISYMFLFLHDLVVMTLVMAACAAATAIGYVGKHGNAYIGWIPVCDHLSKFCDRVTISIAMSYASFLLLMILTVISACNYGTVFRSANSKFRGGDYVQDQSY